MLLITGRARPIDGARERMITAIREITEATQSDPGCLHYVFGASLDDDTIISVELWQDRAALEAHMGHEHTRRFLGSLDGLLDGIPVMQETELQPYPITQPTHRGETQWLEKDASSSWAQGRQEWPPLSRSHRPNTKC